MNTIGSMCRNFVFLLTVFLLLVGCQANGDSASPMLAGAAGASISETSTPTDLAEPTDTVTPTGMPTLTLALPTPDPRQYVVKVRKADVWDVPENEGRYPGLQTQLMLGEKVLVLEQKGDWSRIAAVEQPSGKDPSGYPGWVRTEFLAQGWPEAQQYAVVMKLHSYLYSGPDGSVLLSLYLDTRLPVETTQADWVQVRLPDGGMGWLRLGDVRLTYDLSNPIPTDGLVALAESLEGVPYLWGGATPDAIDCSGLFYRVFHAYGLNLLRDANDMSQEGELVDGQNLQAGDMIFSAYEPGGPVVHVAMYLGNDRILDATDYYGVHARSIQEFLHDNAWVTARRYLP